MLKTVTPVTEKIADIYTYIAKGPLASKPRLRAVFARIAQIFSPKAARKKFYGLSLVEAGRPQKAMRVLDSVRSKSSLSKSEQEIYERALKLVAKKKRNVSFSMLRNANVDFPALTCTLPRDTKFVLLTGKASSQVKDLTNKAAIIKIRFYDSATQEIRDADVSGLSFSDKVGYYRYIAVSNMDSPARIFVKFTPPTHAYKFQLEILHWNLKNKYIFIDDMNCEIGTSANRKTPMPEDTESIRKRQAFLIRGWPAPDTAGAGTKPRILSIMDTFTHSCFKSEAQLISPRPDNWRGLFDRDKPDMVFIESAWQGNEASWQYRIGGYAYKPGQELKELCDYAKTQNVPVVFWNKEDPVHHDKFIEAAKKADVILTTDANIIPSYVEKAGHERVYALPFAAQPALHYPKPYEERKSKACFAGSWYGARHEQRGKDMGWLLPAAAKLGLDIYDRNYGNPNFAFPAPLDQSVVGSLDYEELCREYGAYKVFMNVNSVTDSPTMFSRRVFEILASGTPIVTTYSKGIDHYFGDIVTFVSNEAEAEHAVRELLEDSDLWRRKSLAGIRAVFENHTYAHRLQEIGDRAGLKFKISQTQSLTALCYIENDEQKQRAQTFFEAQKFSGQIKPVFFTDRNQTLAELLTNEPESKKLVLADMTQLRSDNIDIYALMDLGHALIYAPNSFAWGFATRSGDEFVDGAKLDSALKLIALPQNQNWQKLTIEDIQADNKAGFAVRKGDWA